MIKGYGKNEFEGQKINPSMDKYFCEIRTKSRLDPLPMEDYTQIEDWGDGIAPEILVAADGAPIEVTKNGEMTRLPSFNLTSLLNPLNVWRLYKYLKRYPSKSPSRDAAEIFTQSIINYLAQSIDQGSFGEEDIKKAFLEANHQIRKYNHKISPIYHDFLDWNHVSVVGSVAVISNGNLFYGFIADAGIRVFNSGDSLISYGIKTPDEGPQTTVDKEEILKYFDWRNPGCRYLIKDLFINNPEQENSFGVIRGDLDDRVIPYIKTGKIELKQDDIVIAHTDGITDLLDSREMYRILNSDVIDGEMFKSLKEYLSKGIETEGSLALMKILNDDEKNIIKIREEQKRLEKTIKEGLRKMIWQKTPPPSPLLR